MAVDKFSSAAGPNTGLIKVVPTSVTVGSGSGAVDVSGNITFSGSSSISVNGCFTALYDNYRIVLNTASFTGGSVGVLLRMSSAGTVHPTAGDYFNTGSEQAYANHSFTAFGNNGSNAFWNFGRLDSGTPTVGYAYADVLNPNRNLSTGFKSIYSDGNYSGQQGGVLRNSAIFDGFQVSGPTTFSGTVRIYGYNN